MTLAHKAFSLLYPNKAFPNIELRYSGKFNSYNGNVSLQRQGRHIQKISFSLSKEFEECQEDIQMGIIHHLLNKVYKTQIPSLQQELYEKFLIHVSSYAPRQKSEPVLINLYKELNEEYFDGLLLQPNLVFGSASTSTLGHYNYTTDTVTVSTILQSKRELLKFVLYHELLHKKHKFSSSKSGRMQYHTQAFRKDEKKYKIKDIEKRLERFIARKKFRNLLKRK